MLLRPCLLLHQTGQLQYCSLQEKQPCVTWQLVVRLIFLSLVCFFLLFQYLQSLQAYIHVYRYPSQTDLSTFERFPQLPDSFKWFQSSLWVQLILDVNKTLGADLQSRLDVLAKWQSKRLSIDHTFRVVKNVIAYVSSIQEQKEETCMQLKYSFF